MLRPQERGIPEALIATCVLATVGLIAILAWMGLHFITDYIAFPRFLPPDPPAAIGVFAAATAGVLLLLSLAIRRRGPIRLGLTAMLLSLISMALVARLNLHESTWVLLRLSARPNVTAGLILLGMGTIGLLLAAFAPREPTSGRRVPGSMATAAVLAGTLLLFLLSALWMQSLCRLGEIPGTEVLAGALVSFAAMGVISLPLFFLGLRSDAGDAEPRGRFLRLPLGTLFLIGSLAAIATALDVTVLLEPCPGLPHYVWPEFHERLVRPLNEATWTGPLLRIFGLLLILLLELAIRRTPRRRTDARLIVTLHWVAWVAVGGGILYAAGGLAHAAGEVARLGANITPYDLRACRDAALQICTTLPYFGVAQWLAASRPIRPGVGWFRWRRAGVGLLALATMGLVIMAVTWWWSLEGGAGFAAYGSLRSGAEVLRWGAFAFLVCGTIGAVVEFIRSSRLT